MNSEIIAAAALSWVAVTSFVYALGQISKRDINASRFAAYTYDPSQDKDLKKARKDEKRKKEIAVNPSKTLLLSLAGMIVFFFLAYIVVGSFTASITVSLAGLLTPKLWLGWHKRGQEKLLTLQLEQAMEMMSAVLNSGGGIPAALEKAANDIPQPLKSELAQTLAEIKLGISASEAFKNFSERVRLQETSIISMAVELKQSGMPVNLATVFQQVQDNIRARKVFEQEVSSITSENRMAGWIVAAVPFITIAIVRNMAPEFIKPLFTEPIGITIFITCVLVICAGVFWIMKMADAKNFS